MDSDLAFVMGLVVIVLAIPSIISAFSDGRAPRAAAIMVMIGGALLALALYQRPNGYSIAGIPDVFVTVFARYIN